MFNVANLRFDDSDTLEIVDADLNQCAWAIKIVKGGLSCCRLSVDDSGEVVAREEYRAESFWDAICYIIMFCGNDKFFGDFESVTYKHGNRVYYIENADGAGSLSHGSYYFGWMNPDDDSDELQMSCMSFWEASYYANIVLNNIK